MRKVEKVEDRCEKSSNVKDWCEKCRKTWRTGVRKVGNMEDRCEIGRKRGGLVRDR